MHKKRIRKLLVLSVMLTLAFPVGALADVTAFSPSTVATTTNVGAQTVTPSTDLSSTGRAVSQLAPTASAQMSAVGLGAVDQTITPERGLFTNNSNVVSSEQQLPASFTPGIIQYDQQNDYSEKINGQLTTQQMETLNNYSNQWMNSLRHIWQASPNQYSYHGRAYQAPNDLVTPPALFDAITKMAADRTRVNYGYDHTGEERIALNADGDTSYGQYIAQANLTPSEEVVRSVAPNATGTSFTVGENLFKLSGSTMLEAEVNLFNRMEDMLWGEATDLNGKLEGANDHLANVLNPLFTHVAMGFQLVSPNHWYVTWDFEGLDNVDHQTGQEYFSDADRIEINRIWDAILMGNANEQSVTAVGNHEKIPVTNSAIENAKSTMEVTPPSQKVVIFSAWPKQTLVVSSFPARVHVLSNAAVKPANSKRPDHNRYLPQTGNCQSELIINLVILLGSGVAFVAVDRLFKSRNN